MFRTIHPNRWLIWTIALIVMIFIVVWGAIQRYAIEQEIEIAGQNSLLGRETSKLDTTGWKTYRGENFGLVNSVGLELPGLELRYPPEWKVHTDGVYGNNHLQDVVLTYKENDKICFQTGEMAGVGCDYPGIIHLGFFGKDILIDYTQTRIVDQDFRKYIDQIIVYEKKLFGFNRIPQFTNIAGREAALLISKENPKINRVIINVSEKMILEVGVGYFKENEQYVLDVYNKLLSTLTFFEPDVSKLPKEQCPCWNSGDNTCLPLSACQ